MYHPKAFNIKMSVSLNERAGRACRKPLKNAIKLAKSPLKHYLKTVYKMVLKSKFFYCHTYELDFSSDVVEGWGWWGGRQVDTLCMGVFFAYEFH